MIKRDQHTVILSVAENGVRLGKGTDIGTQVSGSEKGFYVFAENVTLSDPFSVILESTDAITTVSTYNLSLSPVAASTIDVSGTPGINNDTGVSRPDNIDGHPAGSLCTYIESCPSDTVQNLILKARGGDGGDTNEKQGTAGNGGNGGNIQFFSYSYLTEISEMLLFFAQNMSWNRDLPGGQPLTPTHPIVVFLQQVLDVSYTLSKPSSESVNIQSVTSMLKPLTDICEGAKTLQPPTIDNARDAVWDARQAVKSQFDKDRVAYRTNVEGGHGGSFTSSGSPGKPGAQGTILSSDFVREIDPKLLRQQTMVMVHPEQCKMLYDRAMTYWYFGRPETAIYLLDRLLLRTIFLPLQSSDALSQVSSSLCTFEERYLTPNQAYAKQDSLLGSTDSVGSLLHTRQITMQQNSVLQTGKVDFYGFGEHWVPRVSYTEYNDYIDDAMNVFIHLEQSYINYRAALDHQQQTNDAIQQSVSQINGTLASMQEERNTLVESLKNFGNRIDASGPVIEQQHRFFMEKYNDFVDQVNRPPPKGITIDELFNAAASMVSGRTLIGAVAGALGKLWSDFNGDPDSVINEAGVAVNKDYLMQSIKDSIATSLDDFTSELTADEIDGKFTVDGRVPKLILEERTLRDILTQYKTEAFAEAGQDLLEAFDHFIEALEARNDDITAYNSIIQRLVAQSRERKKLDDMKELAQKGTLTNEGIWQLTYSFADSDNVLDLEVMTGYIRMLFENARARVMRSVIFVVMSYTNSDIELTQVLEHGPKSTYFQDSSKEGLAYHGGFSYAFIGRTSFGHIRCTFDYSI